MAAIKGFAIRDRNGNHVNGGKLNGANGHGLHQGTGGNGVAMPPTHLVSTNDRLENHRDPNQLRLIDSIVDTRQAPVERTPPRALRPSPRRWTVTGGAGDAEQNLDRQATDDLIKLVQKLNQAMNAADRIGLVVKPNISTATSQFDGTGSAGHMVSIKVSRKLC